MGLEAWGVTDIGLKRKSNQDSILVDTDLGFCLVADGMGGHKGGDIAAQMAVEIVCQFVEKHIRYLDSGSLEPEKLLVGAYKEASALIYKCSMEEKIQFCGMGTTLVSAFIRDGFLYIGNVGDSRAYFHKKPYLWQLTEDHSFVYEQLKYGNASSLSEGAEKSIITRSVGFEEAVMVDVVKKKISKGDEFLMCSDGLTGPVSNEKINKILKNTKPHEVPQTCVDAAKEAGGDDNISVVFMKY